MSYQLKVLILNCDKEIVKQRKDILNLAQALNRLEKCLVLKLNNIGDDENDNQETQIMFELIAHVYGTSSPIIMLACSLR
jgi:DNA replication protein DnaC